MVSVSPLPKPLDSKEATSPRTKSGIRRQLTDIAAFTPQATVAASPGIAPFQRRNLSLGWTPESREWDLPALDNSFAGWLQSGRRLRVLGECWGMSAVSHPATFGSVIVAKTNAKGTAQRVCWSSPKRDAVTCTLGCTFEEVHDFLAREGGTKALANQPGYSKLSVMGTLGTGGHGSGLSQGPLESLVKSVTLASIHAPWECLRFDRHDPDFGRVVHHMGRLGPVVEVELYVRDAFRVAEQRQIKVLGQRGKTWQHDLRELVHEAVAIQQQPDVHSAEIWIAPYAQRGELVAALGTRRYTDEPLSSARRRPATLRYEILQLAGRALATLLAKGVSRLTPWVLETAVRSTHTPRPVVMDARTGLDFGAPNVNRMGSIEAGIELERGADALIAALGLLADLAQRSLYVFSPLGVRFVGRALNGNLSPQSGRASTLHIEVPTLANDRLFNGALVLAPLQRLLATEFDGRPHWGQRVYLTPDELARLWPHDALHSTARLIERLDPDGVFANPLVDATLKAASCGRA